MRSEGREATATFSKMCFEQGRRHLLPCEFQPECAHVLGWAFTVFWMVAMSPLPQFQVERGINTCLNQSEPQQQLSKAKGQLASVSF